MGAQHVNKLIHPASFTWYAEAIQLFDICLYWSFYSHKDSKVYAIYGVGVIHGDFIVMQGTMH